MGCVVQKDLPADLLDLPGPEQPLVHEELADGALQPALPPDDGEQLKVGEEAFADRVLAEQVAVLRIPVPAQRRARGRVGTPGLQEREMPVRSHRPRHPREVRLLVLS